MNILSLFTVPCVIPNLFLQAFLIRGSHKQKCWGTYTIEVVNFQKFKIFNVLLAVSLYLIVKRTGNFRVKIVSNFFFLSCS